ncbi:MAG: preprotein translocase subunit SecE [Mycoplasmatales bacterium]
MEKFRDSLKKIQWPTSKEVMQKFMIVMFFLIALIIFIMIIDGILGYFVGQIY